MEVKRETKDGKRVRWGGGTLGEQSVHSNQRRVIQQESRMTSLRQERPAHASSPMLLAWRDELPMPGSMGRHLAQRLGRGRARFTASSHATWRPWIVPFLQAFARALDRAGPEEDARISLGLFHLLFDAIGVRKGAEIAGSTAVSKAAAAAAAGSVGMGSSASEEEVAAIGEVRVCLAKRQNPRCSLSHEASLQHVPDFVCRAVHV